MPSDERAPISSSLAPSPQDPPTTRPAAPDQTSIVSACQDVHHHAREAKVQTRHLIVYNTGPAVGVDELTLHRVFEAYGPVERVLCPDPAAARVLVTFKDVTSAVRAKTERNRPPEVEERVRRGVPRAAMASEVYAPRPNEPCPLLGRWLKVDFADIRLRRNQKRHDGNINNGGRSSVDTLANLSIPAFLADFKALDALATGGASSSDTRRTPCPLCGRSFGGQRGLRMHLAGAHPLDVRDREHLVRLLKKGGDAISHEGRMPRSDIDPGPRIGGAGAAAKGQGWTGLPPGFAAARCGDLPTLRGLVEAGWDPVTATDKNGSSALDWAAGEGRLSVCRQDPGYLLEECGVDPTRSCSNRGRGEGRTALHWAARGGHDEVCRLILETPHPSHCRSNSDEGTRRHNIDNTDSYLCADAAAAEGTTSFHWAAWGAHLSTCQLLLDRGADHRRVNAYGCNVAHWCGLSGDVKVCRWLARSVEEGGAGGLDWAKTNTQGHTICHKAALKGHKDLLEWLRRQTEGGVVPETAWGKDDGGYTPAQVARLAGHVDLAAWLEETVMVTAKAGNENTSDRLLAYLLDPLKSLPFCCVDGCAF